MPLLAVPNWMPDNITVYTDIIWFDSQNSVGYSEISDRASRNNLPVARFGSVQPSCRVHHTQTADPIYCIYKTLTIKSYNSE